MRKTLSVNDTKEEVIDFIKNELKLEVNDKFSENEFDGEALGLLRIFDVEPEELGLKGLSDLDKIIESLDEDFLKVKDNINEDKLYLEILNENLDKIWTSLDKKLELLKLGEQLKYMKYLFFIDPPPSVDKKEELSAYLKKILKLENDIIEQINIKQLSELKEKSLDKSLGKLKITDIIELFKIKMILEIIKKGLTKKEKTEKIIENVNLHIEECYYVDPKKENIKTIEAIYILIDIYDYETSQNEYALGLKNPIEEFKIFAKILILNLIMA